MNRNIITIDGPAGAGKTTLARSLAHALQLPYMDTGAMFRFLAMKLGPDSPRMDGDKLRSEAEKYEFTLSGTGDQTRLMANGIPIGEEIRSNEISALASALAVRPEIRDILRRAQQRLGQTTSLVAEGRDLGTVVFPQATHKFFMEASPEVRARRRWLQLREKGAAPDLATIETAIRQRDAQDRNRAEAPLRAADNAIIIDTSYLTITETLAKLLSHVSSSTSSPA